MIKVINDIQELERVYSEIYWSKDMDEYEDLAHLVLHNNKMLGALSSIVEVGQHAAKGSMDMPRLPPLMKKRVIGNYLVWGYHYANTWNLSPLDCFLEKQERNVSRFKSEELYRKRI